MKFTVVGDGDQVTGRLQISSGPVQVVDQFLLTGDRPLAAGRSPENPILLDGVKISRIHCEFARGLTGWEINDNASRNGVVVNAQRMAHHELSTGDIIALGDVELAYWDVAPPVEERLTKPTASPESADEEIIDLGALASEEEEIIDLSAEALEDDLLEVIEDPPPIAAPARSPQKTPPKAN